MEASRGGVLRDRRVLATISKQLGVGAGTAYRRFQELRFPVRFEEDFYQQAAHGSVIQHDPFCSAPATGRFWCQFQSIQSTFPRQSLLNLVPTLHQRRQRRMFRNSS